MQLTHSSLEDVLNWRHFITVITVPEGIHRVEKEPVLAVWDRDIGSFPRLIFNSAVMTLLV